MSKPIIPPGEYLAEVLEALRLSQSELARRIGRDRSFVSLLKKGSMPLTAKTAIALEKATGVSAHVWAGLEASYRIDLARAAQEGRR